jgi:3-oxoacyl-(acyl-carrier-protein) synthase
MISPQRTHSTTGFPAVVAESVTDRLTCFEPDYREHINPVQLRRMPRILKMGLASAQICLDRANNVTPNAIIVGTGLGCLDNLEKFLLQVLNTDEHITSVLPFINSTHNAVAAQIAMLLKNHSYNITYCHRGFSFESALQDAVMQIEEKQATNILVGGIDECTDDFMKLHGYLGFWKKPLGNLQLLAENSSGTIAGEGSAFFVISGEPEGTAPKVCIEGVHTFLTPQEPLADGVSHEIELFLRKAGMDLQDVEGVMFGLNGDKLFDKIYYDLEANCFAGHTDFMFFKHLCGEYYTASAFALWLGSVVLKDQTIPDAIRLRQKSSRPIRNLLLYNHFRNTEHTLILLKNGQF